MRLFEVGLRRPLLALKSNQRHRRHPYCSIPSSSSVAVVGSGAAAVDQSVPEAEVSVQSVIGSPVSRSKTLVMPPQENVWPKWAMADAVPPCKDIESKSKMLVIAVTFIS